MAPSKSGSTLFPSGPRLAAVTIMRPSSPVSSRNYHHAIFKNLNLNINALADLLRAVLPPPSSSSPTLSSLTTIFSWWGNASRTLSESNRGCFFRLPSWELGILIWTVSTLRRLQPSSRPFAAAADDEQPVIQAPAVLTAAAFRHPLSDIHKLHSKQWSFNSFNFTHNDQQTTSKPFDALMILNDKTARFITKSPLIPLAMLLFGSVWFALSVLAVVVAVILPFTKRKPPPKAQASSNTIVFIPSDAPVPLGSFPSKTEIRIPQEGTYHVSFANHTGSMQHGTGRVGPPMLTVIPPLSGSITITTTPDSADVSLVSAPPPLASPPLPVVSEDDDERLVASPEVAPDDATLVGEEGSVAPVIPLVRRSTLGMRLPTIFRRKPSKSSGAPTSSRPSSPCSPSPPSLHCNFVDLKSDSECEARPPLRRKKYQRTVDDVETFRTTFVNPLRLKNRRAHSSSVSSAPVEATSLPPSPTPPPSAFTSHRRNRSLASYINLSVRSNSPSRSASPHRGSFSSCSTASSSPGPNSTSRRSFSFSSSQASSERDVRRTQPYGAPYYAAMPVPKPRRSLDSQAGAPKASPRTRNWDGQVEVEAGRRHKQDATDASAYSSAVEEDGNALGLSLGETVPHQRHREIWGGAGAIR